MSANLGASGNQSDLQTFIEKDTESRELNYFSSNSVETKEQQTQRSSLSLTH